MMPPHTPHNEAWTTKRTPFLAGAVHGAARPAAATPHTQSPRARGNARSGKRGVLIHVDPDLGRRLKILAAQRDSTIHAIGVEAFERLLAEAEKSQ